MEMDDISDNDRVPLLHPEIPERFRTKGEKYEEEEEINEIKTGTVTSAAFTLANATIGAGILGLPFVMATSGLILGIVLLLFFGLMANVTLRFLHLDALLSGETTFERLGKQAVGYLGFVGVLVCSSGTNFGAMVSYIIILGDFLTPLAVDAFGDNTLASNREFLQMAVTFLILLPLSLWPRILELGWISTFSVLVAYTFVGTVVYHFAVTESDNSSEKITYAQINLDFLSSFGVTIFAYDVHTNLIPVGCEMKDNSFSNMATAINMANSIIISSFLVCAIFGYLTFLGDTDGNILNNYEDSDVTVTIVRILMSIVISFTYPLCIFPLRNAVDALMCESCRVRPRDNDDDSDDPTQTFCGCELIPSSEVIPDPQFGTFSCCVPFCCQDSDTKRVCGKETKVVTAKNYRNVLEAFVFTCLALILATNIPDVEVVLSFVGGTFSSCTIFIFPGLFYLKLKHKDNSPGKYKVVAAILLIIFGIFTSLLTTGVTIYSYAS